VSTLLAMRAPLFDRCSKHRTNEKIVGQITHNSFIAEKKSCDRFRLRVKSDPFNVCLIVVCQYRRRRSDTELTTDSHSRRPNAEDHAPKHPETAASVASVSTANPSLSARSRLLAIPNAGPPPAFLLRAPLHPRARRAGFISVSGQCAARSALSSDMRIKRTSGGVAATEHLRAPMNSPTGGFAVQRVSF
jgi:hypothetical protein